MHFAYLTQVSFWSLLPAHLFLTAIVAAVGWGLHQAIACGSESRRVHGRYVLGWAVACYFFGWFLGPALGADSPLGLTGFAGFCLLIGWLLGTLHGAFVLAWQRWNTPKP